MRNFPDVTMRRCPVRGIVFYAEGMGELAFKTAKEAQAATDNFRKQRELTEQEVSLSSPNRVVCSESEVVVFTDNDVVKSFSVANKREARKLIGTLKEWNTHAFFWV